MSYTIKNLRDVEDSAPRFGYGEMQEARFARRDLAADGIGLSHHVVKPGRRQGFGHRHGRAEEVYVVVRGSGRMRLDDEIIEVRELDAIRVAPQVVRAFEGGPDGLEVLAFGQHYDGDTELLDDFWPE
jgi:mannose-6-phosphate isomerase-like protein (cupin superfamily)